VSISYRLRRGVFSVVGALLMCLGASLTAGPALAQAPAAAASPAAHFAAIATVHQNNIIDKIMAKRPGGTRVAAGEVRWPDGVVLFVNRAATENCPTQYYCGCEAGYFCVYPVAYTGQWFGIPNYQIAYLTYPNLAPNTPYFAAWGSCTGTVSPGCDLGVHAWANNSGYRTWLEQYVDSGNELCISNRTNNLNYNGNNDDDYWLYLSDNPAAC
jgi:hypothetical protein